MNLDTVVTLGGFAGSASYRKNPAEADCSTASFSELVDEMRRAKTESGSAPECESQSRESKQEDWEKDWELEQQRLERQRKMSDRAEAKRKQAALHRAAKRKRLLEYMLFLKETSLERSEIELQRIKKQDEQSINKNRYRKKTVYVPVNYTGCARLFERGFFDIL